MYCQYFCTGMNFFVLLYTYWKKVVNVVSNRIRELRKEKGLSIDEMSEQLKKKGVNISPASISKYEREERKPKIDNWIKLANFFGVPVSYLQFKNDNKKFTDDYISDLINQAIHSDHRPEYFNDDWEQLQEKSSEKVSKILNTKLKNLSKKIHEGDKAVWTTAFLELQNDNQKGVEKAFLLLEIYVELLDLLAFLGGQINYKQLNNLSTMVKNISFLTVAPKKDQWLVLNELKEQVNKFINSMPLDNNRDKSKKD